MAIVRTCATCGTRYTDEQRYCPRDGTPLAEAPPIAADAAEPLVAGRYALLERIGTGAVGTVYRADDVPLRRTVALKLIHGGDATLVERLVQEGRVVSRLRHPNVVVLHDLGELPDGGAYLALEWVDGESLAHVLRARGGPLRADEVVDVGLAVAAALGAAHAMGVLHSDVKPANVLVPRTRGRLDFAAARLSDFGVQRALDRVAEDGRNVTRAGLVVGTPAYMAPEQLLGAPSSAATDLFGLGAVLYELLVGEPPGGGGPPAQLLVRRLQSDVSLPAAVPAPAALRTLVDDLLHREPTRRPQTADEVHLRLEALRRAAPPGDAELTRTVDAARPALVESAARSATTEPGVATRTEPWHVPAPAGVPAPPPARGSPALPLLVAGAVVATLLVASLPSLGRPGGSWRLVVAPALVIGVGVALFAAVQSAIDRRRTVLVAQSAEVGAAVQAAIIGTTPLDREGISRTIVTTVDAIIHRCASLDERLIGQTIVAIAHEYASEASTPESRMAALVQIPQQLERLSEKIAARSTPWYVRHEKLLAAGVSGTAIVGGLAKVAIDVLAAGRGAPSP